VMLTQARSPPGCDAECFARSQSIWTSWRIYSKATGDRGGGRVDRKTGDCWPEIADYEDNEDDEDKGRWLYVECEGARPGYSDMELFIETVDDPAIVDRLEIAIRGKGAFGRFKDVLSRWP
jgi:hypothetical protein